MITLDNNCLDERMLPYADEIKKYLSMNENERDEYFRNLASKAMLDSRRIRNGQSPIYGDASNIFGAISRYVLGDEW